MEEIYVRKLYRENVPLNNHNRLDTCFVSLIERVLLDSIKNRETEKRRISNIRFAIDSELIAFYSIIKGVDEQTLRWFIIEKNQL